jgi:hypothetical protein
MYLRFAEKIILRLKPGALLITWPIIHIFFKNILSSTPLSRKSVLGWLRLLYCLVKIFGSGTNLEDKKLRKDVQVNSRQKPLPLLSSMMRCFFNER